MPIPAMCASLSSLWKRAGPLSHSSNASALTLRPRSPSCASSNRSLSKNCASRARQPNADCIGGRSQMQRNVVIAGFACPPFHFANKAELPTVRPAEWAAQVVLGLLEKPGVDPAEIEDLILGCAFPEGEQGLNLARLVGFLAALPPTVPGQTT